LAVVPGRDEESFAGSRVLLSLRLPRDPATVTLARDLAGGVLRRLGVTSACVDDVRLVVSEACTNAVKYAVTADDYQVRIAVDDRRCTIEVVDSGQGFDLRAVSDEMPAPDAPSGRGVALMRYLTDELEVRSDPAHGTSVRMAKLLHMERDGGTDGARSTRPVYDSKPPKPPR
jgi:serine/threonine-protein kinase RsbW